MAQDSVINNDLMNLSNSNIGLGEQFTKEEVDLLRIVEYGFHNRNLVDFIQ